MSSIEKEWLSLIGEVQKLVLKEEAGSVLLTGEDSYNFFQQKSGRQEAMIQREMPSPVPKAQSFPPFKPAPVLQQQKTFEPAPAVKKSDAANERLSEECKKTTPLPPSFDYKMIKETLSPLKPSLKILEELKEGSIQPKDPRAPACLLIGNSTPGEQQMTDSIKGAIEEVLKKGAKTLLLKDSASVEGALKAISSPEVKFIIISEESLKAEKALQDLYRTADSGKPGYLGGIPAALVLSFRILNEAPAAKRALWNLIKAALQETSV